MSKRERNHERDRGLREGDPLVIDLPEGQKLYVGNLEDGMAIEVEIGRAHV